jgi:hypothetical protein
MDTTKILNFPGFRLRAPSSWTMNFDKNFPNSIFVNMDLTDKFKIDIGINSRNISNYQAITTENISIQQVVDEENESRVIDEKASSKAQTIYSDDYSDIIANREVKCLIPRIPGKGTTGIFFSDSNSLTKIIPFISFVAFNLKEENQLKFFEAIRTLEFDK